jgi:hypothetical protein
MRGQQSNRKSQRNEAQKRHSGLTSKLKSTKLFEDPEKKRVIIGNAEKSRK